MNSIDNYSRQLIHHSRVRRTVKRAIYNDIDKRLVFRRESRSDNQRRHIAQVDGNFRNCAVMVEIK